MSSNSKTSSPSITLFRGWLDPGKHVWSPFVIKTEARLRFAGIKYATDRGSPLHAPKGKIPYLEYHGELPTDVADASSTRYDENSEPITSLADSALIIKTLTKAGVLSDLNAGLTAQEKVLDLGIRTMLEDRLYFYHTRERWIDNYYTMRDHALSAIPYPIRIFVGILAARKHSAMLYGQGTLRFTQEELTGFKHEIWGTLAELLQVRKGEALRKREAQSARKADPFWVLGGKEPTEADTVLFGFVITVLISTAGPDSQKVVKGYPVLVEYAERIHDRYFPDYEKGTMFTIG
ncbi:hypothetical protein GE09DRAFT_1064108 [Coniochaeta sp. 2T2.1]|nr:hypothetical protein GE09DRAFT_1064108 [Coniochaeta sp. 2T2.1]